jgi:antitoxin component of RelBE/YafQ-DinJ toxin-antitoxin module
MTKHAETPRQFIGFRIDEELIAGMKAVAKRDGVAVSEQVRRAIRMWLEQKGVMKERKRPASRKRR